MNTKKAKIEEKTNYLLAENLYTSMDPQKFVDWAVDLLENGLESEHVLILAGLDNYPREEIEAYFWKCIDDLKLNIKKSDFELIENFAIHIANSVINNSIKPQAALSTMTALVKVSDYSSKYIQFYNLAEDIDCLHHDGQTLFNSFDHTNHLDEVIREEFSLFLRAEHIKLDDKYRAFAYCLNCQTMGKPKLKSNRNWLGSIKSHYWACTNCGSKQLAHFTGQEGKQLILTEVEKMSTSKLNH